MASDLFGGIGIGFDSVLEAYTNLEPQYKNTSLYPPYKIERTSPNRVEVQVDVAGYGQDEISINMNDMLLKVMVSFDNKTHFRDTLSNEVYMVFLVSRNYHLEKTSVENGVLKMSFSSYIASKRDLSLDFKDESRVITTEVDSGKQVPLVVKVSEVPEVKTFLIEPEKVEIEAPATVIIPPHVDEPVRVEFLVPEVELPVTVIEPPHVDVSVPEPEPVMVPEPVIEPVVPAIEVSEPISEVVTVVPEPELVPEPVVVPEPVIEPVVPVIEVSEPFSVKPLPVIEFPSDISATEVVINAEDKTVPTVSVSVPSEITPVTSVEVTIEPLINTVSPEPQIHVEMKSTDVTEVSTDNVIVVPTPNPLTADIVVKVDPETEAALKNADVDLTQVISNAINQANPILPSVKDEVPVDISEPVVPPANIPESVPEPVAVVIEPEAILPAEIKSEVQVPEISSEIAPVVEEIKQPEPVVDVPAVESVVVIDEPIIEPVTNVPEVSSDEVLPVQSVDSPSSETVSMTEPILSPEAVVSEPVSVQPLDSLPEPEVAVSSESTLTVEPLPVASNETPISIPEVKLDEVPLVAETTTVPFSLSSDQQVNDVLPSQQSSVPESEVKSVETPSIEVASIEDANQPTKGPENVILTNEVVQPTTVQFDVSPTIDDTQSPIIVDTIDANQSSELTVQNSLADLKNPSDITPVVASIDVPVPSESTVQVIEPEVQSLITSPELVSPVVVEIEQVLPSNPVQPEISVGEPEVVPTPEVSQTTDVAASANSSKAPEENTIEVPSEVPPTDVPTITPITETSTISQENSEPVSDQSVPIVTFEVPVSEPNNSNTVVSFEVPVSEPTSNV